MSPSCRSLCRFCRYLWCRRRRRTRCSPLSRKALNARKCPRRLKGCSCVGWRSSQRNIFAPWIYATHQAFYHFQYTQFRPCPLRWSTCLATAEFQNLMHPFLYEIAGALSLRRPCLSHGDFFQGITWPARLYPWALLFFSLVCLWNCPQRFGLAKIEISFDVVWE